MVSEQANGPEHSMVDGLIELSLQRGEERTTREIEVLKLRGVDHFLGRHEMDISSRGIQVRPRLEMFSAKWMKPAPPTRFERATSGVEHLDAMLGGGLVRGNATLLLGFSGAGKTLLSMHFLAAGAAACEHSLYFGFYESPDRLFEAAESVGLPVEKHRRAGTLHVMWQQPLKHGLDTLGQRLLGAVDEHGVRRVVIDGIDGFRQGAAFPQRTIRFVTALVNELRVRGVTTILTEETQKLFGPEVEVRIEGLSALVDNIVLLEYLDVGPELKRLLSIVKQRASDYDTSVRELVITNQGLRLHPSDESARLILSGVSGARRGRGGLSGGGAHGPER
jgi:circadian clock protein KaiC